MQEQTPLPRCSVGDHARGAILGRVAPNQQQDRSLRAKSGLTLTNHIADRPRCLLSLFFAATNIEDRSAHLKRWLPSRHSSPQRSNASPIADSVTVACMDRR